MKKLDVIIVKIDEDKKIYGKAISTNLKSSLKDMPKLSLEYNNILKKEVIPFYVINKNYDFTTEIFDLMVGGEIQNNNLEEIIIPQGTYAKISIKPRIGLLWNFSVNFAKQYFYKVWLVENPRYKELNFSYEYYGEKSTLDVPEIDLYFKIDKTNFTI